MENGYEEGWGKETTHGPVATSRWYPSASTTPQGLAPLRPGVLGRDGKEQLSEAELPPWLHWTHFTPPQPLCWDTADWIRAKAKHVNKASLSPNLYLVPAKFGTKIT